MGKLYGSPPRYCRSSGPITTRIKYSYMAKEVLADPSLIEARELFLAYYRRYRSVDKAMEAFKKFHGTFFVNLVRIYDALMGEETLFRGTRAVWGKHTRAEWEAKKKEYDYKCAYCGEKRERLTKDHIIPIALGGNNLIENIAPACWPCNAKKHTADWDETRKRFPKMAAMLGP